jgi:hypothetical protein
MVNMMIPVDKIREVIGTGGKVINQIIDECGQCKIDIEDDGRCVIYHNDQEMLDKAKTWIENIIREAKVGDIYEVANAVQYDFDLVQINGTEMGTLNERETPFIPCKAEGRFAAKTLGTGDRFNDSADDSALLKRLGASLRDMEGAAIAHVCETAGVELVSYKCISDVEGSGSMPEQYMENLKKCLSILTDFSKTLFMV